MRNRRGDLVQSINILEESTDILESAFRKVGNAKSPAVF